MIFLNFGLALVLMMEGIVTTLNIIQFKDPFTMVAVTIIAFVYGFLISETRRFYEVRTVPCAGQRVFCPNEGAVQNS